MGIRGRDYAVLAPLGALLAMFALVPAGLPRETAYPIVAAICLLTAIAGLPRVRAGRRTGWVLVLGGFLMWVIGDVIFFTEQRILEMSAYPAPSDAVYVAAYLLLAAGLVVIVRRRGERTDVPALLDAAVLATGVGVVAGVFVIAPIAVDSTLSTAGKLTASFYPLADVLLLAILVRLWTTPGAKTASFGLLAGALASTLAADVMYNVTTILSGDLGSTLLNDVLWLLGYALAAGAVWSSSVNELTEPSPGREDLADPSRRLLLLTGGLMLPAVALLADGVVDDEVEWEIAGVGSLLLSVLVVVRMGGLLKVVQAQAVQLAALARADSLTGVPNRRTWDHELSRACRDARETGEPLTVALLDLDYFKDYNDAHGHLAGDRLLREVTAVWSDLLGRNEMLARYGGEEFAVLFRGQTAAEAKTRVITLLENMPQGVTCSGGIAEWEPLSDPSTAVAAADKALYRAKRAGRAQAWVARSGDPTGEPAVEPVATPPSGPVDRLLGGPNEPTTPAGEPGAPGSAPTDELPTPTIVMQPIVDLTTNEPVAVEALSRFLEGEPLDVFDKARSEGAGPALEAAAIRASLETRPPNLLIAVNVGMDALATLQVRNALTGDLTGVILEVTEHPDLGNKTELMDAIADYRKRGALIAIDDWGRGFSNLDRVLDLKPEIVKIDMSLVHGLDSQYHSATIGAAVAWANSVGTKLCAEGVENAKQLEQLRDLGVHYGQGYFLGRPATLPHLPAGAQAADRS